MVFYCGLYFALRSGQEHRHLQLSQIELFESEGEGPYLVYMEIFPRTTAAVLHRGKLTEN